MLYKSFWSVERKQLWAECHIVSSAGSQVPHRSTVCFSIGDVSIDQTAHQRCSVAKPLPCPPLTRDMEPYWLTVAQAAHLFPDSKTLV